MRVALVAAPGRVNAARATVRSVSRAEPAARIVVLAADPQYEAVGAERIVTPDMLDLSPAVVHAAQVRLEPAQLADLLAAALVDLLVRADRVDADVDELIIVLAAGIEVLGPLGAAKQALLDRPRMPGARLVGGGPGAVVVRPGARDWCAEWLVAAADWKRPALGPYTDEQVRLPLLDLSRADPDRPWVLDPDNPDPAVLLSRHPALASLVADRLGARRADRSLVGGGRVSDPAGSGATTTLGFPVDAALRALWRAPDGADLPDLFNDDDAAAAWDWLISPPGPGYPPRYLAGVWAARPDLQAAFPQVPGVDTGRLLDWARRHGAADLPDAADLLAAALRRAADASGRAAPGSAPDDGSGRADGAGGRGRPGAAAVRAKRAAEGVGRLAARTRRSATASARAAARGIPAARGRGRAAEPATVDVVGFLGGDLGIGASARLLRDALAAAGVPVRTRTITPWTGPRGPRPDALAPRARGVTPRAGDVTLLCVNAAELGAITALPGADWQGTRRIGYWYWEVAEFPATQHPAFALVDEVWVATEFVRAAIAPHSPVPVLTLPPPLWREPSAPTLTRAELGLPDGRPIVLFTFDFLSTAERKNPWGAVTAFRQAFPRRPGDRDESPSHRPLLVIKSVNAGLRVADAERLRLLVAGDPDVLLVERRSTPAELDALFGHCDVYLSLHRSEGLGLTIAEAMCHAKPVVTTAYGGVVDFVDDSCGYAVPWRPAVIPTGCAPYPAGGTWAEPDLAEAARLLREAVTDPLEARRRGAAGAARLRERHSPAVAGAALATRLAQAPERHTPPRGLG